MTLNFGHRDEAIIGGIALFGLIGFAFLLILGFAFSSSREERFAAFQAADCQAHHLDPDQCLYAFNLAEKAKDAENQAGSSMAMGVAIGMVTGSLAGGRR